MPAAVFGSAMCLFERHALLPSIPLRMSRVNFDFHSRFRAGYVSAVELVAAESYCPLAYNAGWHVCSSRVVCLARLQEIATDPTFPTMPKCPCGAVGHSIVHVAFRLASELRFFFECLRFPPRFVR